MKHLLRLTDWTRDDVAAVFALADAYRKGRGPRSEGAAVMFLPSTGLRTRLTFERGADLMGLQPILFPPETLDKPESLVDVAGYLANWAQLIVVRHPDIGKLERLAAGRRVPVINAMTSVNHPCEVLSDAYAFRQMRPDLRRLTFLFVGGDGNILRTWQELAGVLDLKLSQCCAADLATPGLDWTDDLDVAIAKADVVLTDGVGPNKRALGPLSRHSQAHGPRHARRPVQPVSTLHARKRVVRRRRRLHLALRRLRLQGVAAARPAGRHGALPRARLTPLASVETYPRQSAGRFPLIDANRTRPHYRDLVDATG
jgi:ornithine carbamoyltransferase